MGVYHGWACRARGQYVMGGKLWGNIWGGTLPGMLAYLLGAKDHGEGPHAGTWSGHEIEGVDDRDDPPEHCEDITGLLAAEMLEVAGEDAPADWVAAMRRIAETA